MLKWKNNAPREDKSRGVDIYEDDLSAEKAAKEERARIPQEDEDQQWPQCPEAEKDQGQETPVGIKGQASSSMAHRPEVLRFKRDFDRIYKSGRSKGDKYVVVLHRANGLGHSRRAFLASRKVGGAVTRNRARRLMKESFRKMENEIKPGTDILFIARSTIAGTGCAAVEASMRQALRKSGLLQ